LAQTVHVTAGNVFGEEAWRIQLRTRATINYLR
jgi:hypothetical protein